MFYRYKQGVLWTMAFFKSHPHNDRRVIIGASISQHTCVDSLAPVSLYVLCSYIISTHKPATCHVQKFAQLSPQYISGWVRSLPLHYALQCTTTEYACITPKGKIITTYIHNHIKHTICSLVWLHFHDNRACCMFSGGISGWLMDIIMTSPQ